jgi:hypothetical protein
VARRDFLATRSALRGEIAALMRNIALTRKEVREEIAYQVYAAQAREAQERERRARERARKHGETLRKQGQRVPILREDRPAANSYAALAGFGATNEEQEEEENTVEQTDQHDEEDAEKEQDDETRELDASALDQHSTLASRVSSLLFSPVGGSSPSQARGSETLDLSSEEIDAMMREHPALMQLEETLRLLRGRLFLAAWKHATERNRATLEAVEQTEAEIEAYRAQLAVQAWRQVSSRGGLFDSSNLLGRNSRNQMEEQEVWKRKPPIPTATQAKEHMCVLRMRGCVRELRAHAAKSARWKAGMAVILQRRFGRMQALLYFHWRTLMLQLFRSRLRWDLSGGFAAAMRRARAFQDWRRQAAERKVAIWKLECYLEQNKEELLRQKAVAALKGQEAASAGEGGGAATQHEPSLSKGGKRAVSALKKKPPKQIDFLKANKLSVKAKQASRESADATGAPHGKKSKAPAASKKNAAATSVIAHQGMQTVAAGAQAVPRTPPKDAATESQAETEVPPFPAPALAKYASDAIVGSGNAVRGVSSWVRSLAHSFRLDSASFHVEQLGLLATLLSPGSNAANNPAVLDAAMGYVLRRFQEFCAARVEREAKAIDAARKAREGREIVTAMLAAAKNEAGAAEEIQRRIQSSPSREAVREAAEQEAQRAARAPARADAIAEASARHREQQEIPAPSFSAASSPPRSPPRIQRVALSAASSPARSPPSIPRASHPASRSSPSTPDRSVLRHRDSSSVTPREKDEGFDRERAQRLLATSAAALEYLSARHSSRAPLTNIPESFLSESISTAGGAGSSVADWLAQFDLPNPDEEEELTLEPSAMMSSGMAPSSEWEFGASGRSEAAPDLSVTSNNVSSYASSTAALAAAAGIDLETAEALDRSLTRAAAASAMSTGVKSGPHQQYVHVHHFLQQPESTWDTAASSLRSSAFPSAHASPALHPSAPASIQSSPPQAATASQRASPALKSSGSSGPRSRGSSAPVSPVKGSPARSLKKSPVTARASPMRAAPARSPGKPKAAARLTPTSSPSRRPVASAPAARRDGSSSLAESAAWAESLRSSSPHHSREDSLNALIRFSSQVRVADGFWELATYRKVFTAWLTRALLRHLEREAERQRGVQKLPEQTERSPLPVHPQHQDLSRESSPSKSPLRYSFEHRSDPELSAALSVVPEHPSLEMTTSDASLSRAEDQESLSRSRILSVSMRMSGSGGSEGDSTHTTILAVPDPATLRPVYPEMVPHEVAKAQLNESLNSSLAEAEASFWGSSPTTERWHATAEAAVKYAAHPTDTAEQADLDRLMFSRFSGRWDPSTQKVLERAIVKRPVGVAADHGGAKDIVAQSAVAPQHGVLTPQELRGMLAAAAAEAVLPSQSIEKQMVGTAKKDEQEPAVNTVPHASATSPHSSAPSSSNASSFEFPSFRSGSLSNSSTLPSFAASTSAPRAAAESEDQTASTAATAAAVDPFRPPPLARPLPRLQFNFASLLQAKGKMQS